MQKQSSILLLQLITPLVLGIIYYFIGSGPIASVFRTSLFTVGLIIGLALLWLDERWLYFYYADNQGQELDQQASLESQDQANTNAKVKKLITRSLLFVMALIPLSVFMVTSTGSAMGEGVLLGMVAGLLIEMWVLGSDEQMFHKRYLFQLKRSATTKDITWYKRLFTLFVIVITILVMR